MRDPALSVQELDQVSSFVGESRMNPESPLRSSSSVLAAAIAIGCVLLTVTGLAWFRSHVIRGNAATIARHNENTARQYGEFYPATELTAQTDQHASQSATASSDVIYPVSVTTARNSSGESSTSTTSQYGSVVYPNRVSGSSTFQAATAGHPQVSVPVTINVNNGELLTELMQVHKDIDNLRQQRGGAMTSDSSSRKRFSYEVHGASVSAQDSAEDTAENTSNSTKVHTVGKTTVVTDSASSSASHSTAAVRTAERQVSHEAMEAENDFTSLSETVDPTEAVRADQENESVDVPEFPAQSGSKAVRHRNAFLEESTDRDEIVQVSLRISEDISDTRTKAAEVNSAHSAVVQHPTNRSEASSVAVQRTASVVNMHRQTQSARASNGEPAKASEPARQVLIPVELPDFFGSGEPSSSVTAASHSQSAVSESSEFESLVVEAQKDDAEPVAEPLPEIFFQPEPAENEEAQSGSEVAVEKNREDTEDTRITETLQAVPEISFPEPMDSVTADEQTTLSEVAQPPVVEQFAFEPLTPEPSTGDGIPSFEDSLQPSSRLTPELKDTFAKLRHLPPEKLFAEEVSEPVLPELVSVPVTSESQTKATMVSQSRTLSVNDSEESRPEIPRVPVGVDARKQADSKKATAGGYVPFENRYRFPTPAKSKGKDPRVAEKPPAESGFKLPLVKMPRLKFPDSPAKEVPAVAEKPAVAEVPAVPKAPLVPPASVPDINPVPAETPELAMPMAPLETLPSPELSAEAYSQTIEDSSPAFPDLPPMAEPPEVVPPIPSPGELAFRFPDEASKPESDTELVPLPEPAPTPAPAASRTIVSRPALKTTPALPPTAAPESQISAVYEPAWPGLQDAGAQIPMSDESAQRVLNFQRAMEQKRQASVASTPRARGTKPQSKTQSPLATTFRRINKHVAAFAGRSTSHEQSEQEIQPPAHFHSPSYHNPHARQAYAEKSDLKLPSIQMPSFARSQIQMPQIYTPHWIACPPEIDPLATARNSTTLHRVISTVQFAGKSKTVR